MPKVSQEHRDARRQQVIEAAVVCFARQGFHRATMQDIVKQSGLSAGAIYNYFESKEEIIEALAKERHARERALIVEARQQESLAAMVRSLVQGFFKTFAIAKERMHRSIGVQVWAEALFSPQLHRMVREGVDEPRRLLVELISVAQKRGEIPVNLVPEAVARVMIALFQGFVLQQAWDEEVDVGSYIEVIEVFLSSLLTIVQKG